MEDIKLGFPSDMEMPPEPPQKRAEELEDAVVVKKPTRNKGFEQLKQPQKKKPEPEKTVVKATPEEAKAEALRPKLDRPQIRQGGKIVRKGPKGQARPI